MNAKQTLNNLKRYNYIIRARSEELEVIFSKATSITAPMDNEPSGQISDKIGSLVALYIDKETELELTWYVSEVNRIKRLINKLSSAREIQVLYMFYDKGMASSEIASELYTSISNVNRIRRNAEQHLEEILNENM